MTKKYRKRTLFSKTDEKRRGLILSGYKLTTAEILYHMPDHPSFLQSFIWQELDLAPRFPILKKFLRFWEDNLDGPLHSVRVASSDLVVPKEYRHSDFDLNVH